MVINLYYKLKIVTTFFFNEGTIASSDFIFINTISRFKGEHFILF